MSFKLASLAFVLAFLFSSSSPSPSSLHSPLGAQSALTFSSFFFSLSTLTGLSLSLSHLYLSHSLMRHEKTSHGCLSGPFNTHTQSIVNVLLVNAIKILFASRSLFSFSCLAPSNGEAGRGNQMATQTSSRAQAKEIREEKKHNEM